MSLRSPDIFFFILGHCEDLSEPYFPVHCVTNDWVSLLLGLHALEVFPYNRLSRRRHSLFICGLSCLQRGRNRQHCVQHLTFLFVGFLFWIKGLEKTTKIAFPSTSYWIWNVPLCILLLCTHRFISYLCIPCIQQMVSCQGPDVPVLGVHGLVDSGACADCSGHTVCS